MFSWNGYVNFKKKGNFKNFVRMSDILIAFIIIIQKKYNTITAQYEENRNGKFLFMWVALLK